MNQMTGQQMDQKYGPVYKLMLAARTAHAEFMKAKDNQEKAPQLRTEKDRTAEAVKTATVKFTFNEIGQLADYVTGVIFLTCRSTDSKTFDYSKALWLSKVLLSVPDERQLNGGNKNRQQKLGVLRAQSVGTFVELYQTISWVPKFGLSARSVRDGLKRLLLKIDEAQKAESVMYVSELNDLHNRVKTSFPKHWLEEPKPYTPAPAPTLGETLSADSTAALHTVATGTHTPATSTLPPATPARTTRRTTREGRRG